MKRAIASFAVLILAAGGAWAHETSSHIDIELLDGGWQGGAPTGANVLLIETTDTAVHEALTELGVGHDLFNGSDFSTIDLSPYEHVFVAMDGGTVDEPSIVNVYNFVNEGGCLHIYGGTCWQNYAIALNAYLLENNVNDYCWTTVSGGPHSEVTDAAHYLAQGLPATYNFIDLSATYYQTRSLDLATDVAAVNGDGFDHLMSKTIGEGNFDICINSSYGGYYINPDDFDWLTTVVRNMLECGGPPVPTEETTWGQIKAIYQ